MTCNTTSFPPSCQPPFGFVPSPFSPSQNGCPDQCGFPAGPNTANSTLNGLVTWLNTEASQVGSSLATADALGNLRLNSITLFNGSPGVLTETSSGLLSPIPQGANGTFLGVSGGALGFYVPADVFTASGTAGQVLVNNTSGVPTSGAITLTLAAGITGVTSFTGNLQFNGLLGVGAAASGQTALNLATSGASPGLIYGLVDQVTLIPNTNGQSLAGALIQNTVNLNTHTSLEYDGVYISTPTLTGSGSLSFGFMLTVQAPAAGMQGYAEFGSVGSITSTGLNGMAIGTTTPSTGAFTTLSASGAITSTLTGSLFNATTATTQGAYLTFGNTGGLSYFGISNSTGTTFSSTGYAAVVYTPVEFDIIPNGTLYKFAPGSATFPANLSISAGGALSVSGTSTLTGTATIGGSSPAAYSAVVVQNTSSTGFARTVYAIGASGANGNATIDYVPGSFFRIGLNSNDTTTPLVFSTNNNATALTLDTSQNATFAGNILSLGKAVGGNILASANSGTNAAYFTFNSSGGTAYVGQETSAGGSIVIGSGGYGLSLAPSSGHNIYFGTGAGAAVAGSFVGNNFTANGSILSPSATGGIGYTTGAGGTVVQATNKATSVTLNKLTGAITTSNAALAGNTVVSFQVVLSAMGSNDTIITTLKSGAATPGTYEIWASETGGGAFNMNIRNITGGSLSEALVINYVVLKGSNA